MDNNIKAIETSLVLTRRCLSLFNGNAASKLQLEDKILKFEILRNRLLHARSAAAFQPSSVVFVVPLPSTVVAAPSATVTATTATATASTSTSAATIQAPQKYPQDILI